MALSFEELFRIMGRGLWGLGMPYESSKVMIRFYVFFVSLIIVIASEIAYIESIIGQPEKLLEAIALAVCTFSGTLASIKMFVLYINRSKAFSLITRLKEIYGNLSLNENQLREVTFTYRLITYYFVLNIIIIFIYNFSPLVIVLKMYIQTKELVFLLPYAVLMPFSIDTWLRWSGVYLFSSICGFVCIVFIMTVDALFYLLTTQVCISFEGLREDIEILGGENYEKLPDLIKKHQETLQLASDLEEIFSGVNFYNTLIGSIGICLLGFSMSTAPLEKLPGLGLLLTQVLIQMLMMSSFGEKLRQESLKVGRSAYFSKWYDMDQKSKRTMLILMLRSNIAKELTGYKYSIICHETFTTIISTSWSYFTILRQVYNPDT